MLKYLIIQLDDTSPSFCHYPNNASVRRMISLDALKAGILWSMKENLMIQFLYPDYELPEEYLALIDTVDHIDICRGNNDADVSVFDGRDSLAELMKNVYSHVVLRISKDELFQSIAEIQSALKIQPSMNIVITDIASFKENDYDTYRKALEALSTTIIQKAKANISVNINLLTDRLMLKSMNNCNAGDESVTLAPDGKFYVCPAFYFDDEDSIGNPVDGISIPNSHLYKLSYAPICRNCDAYQCKRCVWLNKKTTLEVNTPGHEQCVVAHLERNASKKLLEALKAENIATADVTIPEIDYLDPFDNIKR